MKSGRPPLFRKRQFEPAIIVTCVRWYCRFSLSLRDLEELMAERGLAVDHTTIWRWVQRYGPEVRRRLRGNVKQNSSTWHMDETFVRIAGHWHGSICSGQSTARDRPWISIFRRRAIGKPRNAF
jgi:transposase, IS6 family